MLTPAAVSRDPSASTASQQSRLKQLRREIFNWFPMLFILCVPLLMGMDGGEFLPLVYVVTNAAGGWLGARNGVRSMREDFTKHVNDDTVHVQPPK